MDPGITRLVSEGRHLRDYMLHEVPGVAASALNAALQPFDAGKADPTDEDEAALSDAFQAACIAARGKTDGYTLREVLVGRSPHIRRHPAGITFVLALLAFFAVFFALFWTSWSTKVTSVLALHERYDAFDHDAQILKLIELRRHYRTVSAAVEDPDEIEPPRAFLLDLASIEQHYSDETKLVTELDRLHKRAWPHTRLLEALRRMACPRYPVSGVIEPAGRVRSGVWLGCAPPPEDRLLRAGETVEEAEERLALARIGGPKADEAGAWEGSNAAVDAAAQARSEGAIPSMPVADIRRYDAYEVTIDQASEIMGLAGRQERLLQNYRSTHYTAESRADRLRLKHSLIIQWWLPFVYGALGSIIYCIWRVLSPSHAPLGLLYTLLRMLFAGLAALTLTMLILPSQVLVAGADASQPLVYLVAFAFGYSIEVFIATLNRVNAALTDRLSVREVGDGGRG